MDSHQVAWGLDIGHASIKAVKLARSGDGVTVQGYAIEPVTVPEGGDRDLAVTAALQAIVAREEFGTTPVFAAISGRQVFTRAVNVPVINQKRMHAMVELEARQQIPGDFNEVEWGYHSSPAADGASLDVALFAVKREIIQQLIAKCRTVGLNLAGVSVPSLALYNFIKHDQQFTDGEAVIILDVGAENTDLVVYQGDQLWMRSLPVAGNDITQVFAKKFRVSVAEAETLKRQVHDSRQADKIIKVIESGLAELVSEVNRSLGFYRTQNASANLDNLVISGNTFRLPGLPEYMAEKLRLTINILEDLDRIQVAPGLDRSHFMQDLQSLGVAMGLGLQATGVARANVNLMPSGLVVERLLASKRWAAATIIALLGATLYGHYAIVASADEANTRLSATVKDYTKQNSSRMEKSKQALQQVQELAPQIATFDVVGSHQGLVHAVLTGVAQAVQTVAQDPAFQPAPPADLDMQRVPGLQGVYLRSIAISPPAVGRSAAGRQQGADPLLALSGDRTVTVVVDIAAGGKQEEMQRRLQALLGEVRTPPHLADLIPSPTLFGSGNVQTQGFQSGTQVDWNYIDENRMDAKGTTSREEVNYTLPTITHTFVCTIPGLSRSQETQP